jgi:hypothetical protein
VAFLLLRSISYSLLSSPNRTASSAGHHRGRLLVRPRSLLPSRPPYWRWGARTVPIECCAAVAAPPSVMLCGEPGRLADGGPPRSRSPGWSRGQVATGGCSTISRSRTPPASTYGMPHPRRQRHHWPWPGNSSTATRQPRTEQLATYGMSGRGYAPIMVGDGSHLRMSVAAYFFRVGFAPDSESGACTAGMVVRLWARWY